MSTLRVTFQSRETYTLKDFLEFIARSRPDDVNRYEFIQGRIIMTSPATSGHGITENALSFRLTKFIREHKLGQPFGSSAGFRLPSNDLLQPDFAFVSRERFETAKQAENEFVVAVPSLVVEILSPSTAKLDLTEKKDIYEVNRVDEYWIVDRQRIEVTVFHLEGNRYDSGTCYGSEQEIRSLVLPGFHCPVREFFP